MRTSFHHQPEAQHPNFQLPISWQADYPIFRSEADKARAAAYLLLLICSRLPCSEFLHVPSLQSAHRSEGCNIKAAQEGVLVMTREQKIVAIGSASGVATMIAAVVGIYQIWPNNPSLTDAASRLAYTVQANAFAVIPL